MSQVAIIRCETYDLELVMASLQKGLDLIGGIEGFVKPGETILLKPNLVAADTKEKASTTHPVVFEAVAKLLQAKGVNLTYGDSPAVSSPKAAAKKSGLMAVADTLQIPLADFTNGTNVFFEKGVQNKQFFIANGVLEADGVISLPKLKTHGFERMTGAIKNQFGCIPGPLKGEMHVKIPDPKDFAAMLVDLNHYVSPRLYIMDGIVAMEGNGPRGGTPTPMQVLLLSKDPVALDATLCRLVNLDPQFVPTTVAGMAAGMGTYLSESIELLGDPIASLVQKEFNVLREPVKKVGSFKGLMGIINRAIVPKPVIQENLCVACGLCELMCPVAPKALAFTNGKTQPPTYTYSRCIRCYCCQELCPESAITIKRPIIRRILYKKDFKN